MMAHTFWRSLVFAGILAVAVPQRATSSDTPLPTGERQITLVSAKGERLRLGSVTFTPDGDARTIAVRLDAPGFRDEFLSMRPFRCLPDSREMWCHLAYPYDLSGRITPIDLTDLEYSLLFLFKPPTAYGIDAWNGLYFRFAAMPDGSLSGTVHEVNLDVLAVPPADRSARLIAPPDLTPTDPAAHRFATMEIR